MFLVFVPYNIWNCGHSRAVAMGGNAVKRNMFCPRVCGHKLERCKQGGAGGQRVAPFECEDRFSPSRRILVTQTAKDLLTCTRGLLFLTGVNGLLERRHFPTASGEVMISAPTERDSPPAQPTGGSTVRLEHVP
uniref:Uncharacterized protein n=1 Tax=Ixodes ricinus TaxID=34613 RepID=A0A6B0URL9_IXORI